MVGAPIFLSAKDSGLAVVNSKSLHSTHSKPPVSSSADSKTSGSSEIYSKRCHHGDIGRRPARQLR